jgi:glycerophosphoryl diester phosphodiesterase
VLQYIVGHRGALGLAPENTLKAFHTGCHCGADVIECDIHVSKDKRLVVIHDNTLDRTTNGTGWVHDWSYIELQKFDAGDGEKIPLLEEVVDVAKEYNKKLIIEIKGECYPLVEETTATLTECLSNSKSIHEQIILHSFWHDAIRVMKQHYPHIPAAIVMMAGLQPLKVLQLIREAHANGASIAYDYISEELVSLASMESLFLDAWVLNDLATFNSLKQLGVNGLITNYPGRFIL